MHSLISPKGKKFLLIFCGLASFILIPANAGVYTIPLNTNIEAIQGNAHFDTGPENSPIDSMQSSAPFDIMQGSAFFDTIPASGLDKSRLRYTLAASAVSWAGILILLNEAWYRDYPRSSFHLYNDWGEWFNMDKTGHMFSSYTLSLAGIHLMRKTGMERKKAAWTGGLYGPVFLSTIEILDGFSEEWGFSLADMAANIAGSAIAVSQELFLGHQVVRVKYSYNESGLAKYRPDALGSNLPEKMLKDYNGQTHWLSMNLSSLGGRMEVFPGWLNIAFGYSADGMTGGFSNPSVSNGRELPRFERYRQFYLAPDIDLSAVETGSGFINGLLRTLNFLKIPSPALEYNRVEGFRLHLLYF